MSELEIYRLPSLVAWLRFQSMLVQPWSSFLLQRSNEKPVVVPLLAGHWFPDEHTSWLKRGECEPNVAFQIPPLEVCYSNLLVHDFLWWCGMPYLHIWASPDSPNEIILASEWAGVGLHCYNLQMHKRCYRLLVPIVIAVLPPIGHLDLLSFFIV